MQAAEFDRLVAAACERIPARFRKRLKNVAMIVEAEPQAGQLARGRVPHGGTLLGLYEGRPLTRRSVFEPFAMPDRITIFQGPHERLARGPEHLAKLVEDTVWRSEGGASAAPAGLVRAIRDARPHHDFPGPARAPGARPGAPRQAGGGYGVARGGALLRIE